MRDFELEKRAISSYEELEKIVENTTLSLEELCDELNGYNMEHNSFVVGYGSILATIYQDCKGFLKVNWWVEIWSDETYEYYGTFDINWLKQNREG